MKLADLPEIRAMSAQEKLQLVDELWQNVAREVGRSLSATKKTVKKIATKASRRTRA